MPDRKLAVVFLVTRDVDALASFYKETLGLKLTKQRLGHSAWFDTGSVGLAIHSPEEGEEGGDFLPEGKSVLWFQPSEGVPVAAQTLEKAGVQLLKPRKATNYLFFKDPEGRLLGLHERRSETSQ